MNNLAHFEELRKRLIVSIAAFFLLSAASYFFSSLLLDFFTFPLRAYTHEPLVFQRPYEAFMVHIKISAFSGLLLASPIISAQLWSFVAPGLYEKEKRVFFPVLFVSVGLFLTGVAFAFFLVVPWGLKMMLSFQTENMRPMLAIEPYFSFLTGMLLAFGVLFNFPAVIVGLTELGVVKTAWLAETRKSIVVVIFIASAILTPSPDPLSQLFLALPLWALFEGALILARRREKAKRPSDSPI